MQVPALLRTVLVADGADPDWAGTQVAPPASICADVDQVQQLGVTAVVYEADGTTVSGGTLDLQLIDVAQPAPKQGQPFPPLITAPPVDTSVNVGEGLSYNVSGCRLITVRVASVAALDPGAASIQIFWRALA